MSGIPDKLSSTVGIFYVVGFEVLTAVSTKRFDTIFFRPLTPQILSLM
jgi:hypothetical protein